MYAISRVAGVVVFWKKVYKMRSKITFVRFIHAFRLLICLPLYLGKKNLERLHPHNIAASNLTEQMRFEVGFLSHHLIHFPCIFVSIYFYSVTAKINSVASGAHVFLFICRKRTRQNSF